MPKLSLETMDSTVLYIRYGIDEIAIGYSDDYCGRNNETKKEFAVCILEKDKEGDGRLYVQWYVNSQSRTGLSDINPSTDLHESSFENALEAIEREPFGTYVVIRYFHKFFIRKYIKNKVVNIPF